MSRSKFSTMRSAEAIKAALSRFSLKESPRRTA